MTHTSISCIVWHMANPSFLLVKSTSEMNIFHCQVQIFAGYPCCFWWVVKLNLLNHVKSKSKHPFVLFNQLIIIFSSISPVQSPFFIGTPAFLWVPPIFHRDSEFLQLKSSLWLVVWNIWIILPYLGNHIIPTDEVIFFRGVAQPPTIISLGKTWHFFMSETTPRNQSRLLARWCL